MKSEKAPDLEVEEIVVSTIGDENGNYDTMATGVQNLRQDVVEYVGTFRSQVKQRLKQYPHLEERYLDTLDKDPMMGRAVWAIMDVLEIRSKRVQYSINETTTTAPPTPPPDMP